MSVEFSQNSALVPDTTSTEVSNTTPQLLQEVSAMIGEINSEESSPIKVVEQPAAVHTAAAMILRRGESVAPGEIVTRSRFGVGMPYSRVDLIGSELASLSVTDEGVKAVFIEYQFAEPDDISKVIFDRTVKAQQEKGKVDPNLRYNVPSESLAQAHQRLYSRKNNEPTWSGRSERIAAREFSWSEQSGQIVEKPLADKALDKAIYYHRLLKRNPKRQEDLASKRAKYVPSTPDSQYAVA